jgi:hypothetical protein
MEATAVAKVPLGIRRRRRRRRRCCCYTNEPFSLQF